MSYHNISSTTKSTTNTQGKTAPAGYHYMPDGSLMSDAEHTRLYDVKTIRSFNLDTSNIKAAGEGRRLTILGDKGAVFSLEIRNEDDAYYNFKTNTWTECNNIVRKVDFSSNVPISNFIYGNKGILQFAQEADTDVGLKRQLVQNYWLPHNDFLSDGDHGYDNGTSVLTVTNGDFSSASGWTASGASQNTTAGTVTFDANTEYIQRTDFAAAGDIIEITFTIDSVTGGSLRVTDGSSINVFHASTVPGTYTHYYTATNQTLRFQVHNLHDGLG